ncbi:MAG: NUDIX domain-containing protein [Patescibacteria group bacterium]|nr:NUDIX domain-containing protein [Patescibacteria group bacterium]
MEKQVRQSNIGVGCNVFLVCQNKLLLGKRRNAYGAGSWGLPGGHLERGESMKAAAKRELEEETGFRARNFSFVNLTNDVREDQHYVQIGFLVTDDLAGEPELREPEKCEEWQWFALNNLPENIFVGHKEQIAAFLAKRIFSE